MLKSSVFLSVYQPFCSQFSHLWSLDRKKTQKKDIQLHLAWSRNPPPVFRTITAMPISTSFCLQTTPFNATIVVVHHPIAMALDNLS